MSEAITLQLPDRLYQRLVNTAQATQRSLEAVIVRALEVGAPPDWDDIPAEFQADVAALDRLDDGALWQMVRGRKTAEEMTGYDTLLERHQEGLLTPVERLELTRLRQECDRFMLCKAQAAVILRWRGHSVVSTNTLFVVLTNWCRTLEIAQKAWKQMVIAVECPFKEHFST